MKLPREYFVEVEYPRKLDIFRIGRSEPAAWVGETVPMNRMNGQGLNWFVITLG